MAVTELDARTALVVVDLQNGVVGAPTAPYSAAQVVATTAELAAAFRARGLPVVLVRVSGGAPGRTEASSPARARPDGWDEIVPELSGHERDLLVTKRTWGAFHDTSLDRRLRALGVTQVVLAGIATSIGVESTARAAHEHGYHVALAVDAMTDLDAACHDHSLARIFPRLGQTGTAGQIIELLQAASPQAATGSSR